MENRIRARLILLIRHFARLPHSAFERKRGNPRFGAVAAADRKRAAYLASSSARDGIPGGATAGQVARHAACGSMLVQVVARRQELGQKMLDNVARVLEVRRGKILDEPPTAPLNAQRQ